MRGAEMYQRDNISFGSEDQAWAGNEAESPYKNQVKESGLYLQVSDKQVRRTSLNGKINPCALAG